MSTQLSEISRCEICGSENLESVLDLGKHALGDDLIAVTENRISEEYPVEVLFCRSCISCHQRYQVPKQQLFPESYHYRARFTKDVLDGMNTFVASCEAKLGDLKGKTVVDVGCNDGSLLNAFREKGAVTVGIEPTGAWKDAAEEGHTVFNDFITKL